MLLLRPKRMRSALKGMKLDPSYLPRERLARRAEGDPFVLGAVTNEEWHRRPILPVRSKVG